MGDKYYGLTLIQMLMQVRADCTGSEISDCNKKVCPFVGGGLDDEQICPTSGEAFTLRSMLGTVHDMLAVGGDNPYLDFPAMDACFGAGGGGGRRLATRGALAARGGVAMQIRAKEHAFDRVLTDKCVP